MIFKKLTPEEEDVLRGKARKNYIPFSPISGMKHPVEQEECVRINIEEGNKENNFHKLSVATDVTISMYENKESIDNLWTEYLDEASMCRLCGQCGVIRLAPNMTPGGHVTPGGLVWCVCPNGRACKSLDFNKTEQLQRNYSVEHQGNSRYYYE